MLITINGEKEQVGDELTIASLLDIRQVESPDMVSVQVNGAIIDRSDYDQKQLRQDDEVEFLYFMGGGAI